MPNKQVFIATHLGSGASMLVDMLTAYQKIVKIYRDPTEVYSDPTILPTLWRNSLVHRPNGRIFIDKLVFNYELPHKKFIQIADFIFIIREAGPTLNWLVQYKNYTPECALAYYSYRLRRLCEIANKSPNKLIFTWDELVNKSVIPELKTFFNIKELTSVYKQETVNCIVDPTIIYRGQQCYNKYLKYLRSL